MAFAGGQEHHHVLVFGALRFVNRDGECGLDGIGWQKRKRVEGELVFFEHEVRALAFEDDYPGIAIVQLIHGLVLGEDQEFAGEVFLRAA